MIDSILHFDEIVFEWINYGLSLSIFDQIMPIIRDKTTWIPLYVLIIMWSLKTFGFKRGLIYVLAICITVGLADFTSSQLLKKTFERPRPCHLNGPQTETNLLVPCGHGFSFPSSHAANHFALSLFLIFSLRRKYSWIIMPLLLWASLISLAQIYVGVHYPLDIIGGAIWGYGIALCVWIAYKNIILKKNPLY